MTYTERKVGKHIIYGWRNFNWEAGYFWVIGPFSKEVK